MIVGLFGKLLLLCLNQMDLINFMVMAEEYNIVYASNDAFCSIMGVSIVSLLENNKNADKINFLILSTDISLVNKKKINRLVQSYGRRKPNWVNAVNIEEKLGMKVNKDRGSLSQYARIFLEDIIQPETKRVLYLDCDTVIDGSISTLWSLDLGNNIIGALKDAFSKYYRKNINLSYNDIMFNSGVMLIDMEEWRKHKVEKKIMNFIISHKGRIQQGDQGALNSILSKSTYVISPRYNFISIFSEFSYEQMGIYRKPVDFYSRCEIEQAKLDPIIIHYTSSIFTNRPWEENCKNPYLSKWLKYRSMTPWKNMKLKKKKKSLLRTFYKLAPRSFTLRIAAIFQIYIRPWENYILNKFY